MSLIDELQSNSTDSKYTYDVSDAELEQARKVASARHSSYSDGRTTDEDWSGDSEGAMLRGTIAEMAVVDAYGHLGAEFDNSVSAAGDDGIDLEMEIGGENKTVDVKSSSYDGSGASLMVETDHVENRSQTPDVYLSVYVSEDCRQIEIRGYVTSSELLVESNIRDSRAGDWQNYEVPVSELTEMPETDWD